MTAAVPEPEPLVEGEVIEYEIPSADHVLCAVSYQTGPPVGGEHFPAWQNCGFYVSEIRNETAVHSMEHGAVWVTYAADLDQAELTAIAEAVETESHLLASPYPGLKNPIVLSAWKRQLAVSSWSDPAVADFLADQLGGRSTTAPEAGASCGGAIGTPGVDPDSRYDEAFAQFS